MNLARFWEVALEMRGINFDGAQFSESTAKGDESR
jgi:hypothetical protein